MRQKLLILFIVFISLSGLIQGEVLGAGFSAKVDQPPGYGIPALGINASAEGLVQTITKNVVLLFFAIGGIGSIIYFLWGAVDWILSGGDKEKVSSARKKMTNALIGLVLLSLSFVIIQTIGQIIGFNPFGNLQIRGLGNDIQFVPN